MAVAAARPMALLCMAIAEKSLETAWLVSIANWSFGCGEPWRLVSRGRWHVVLAHDSIVRLSGLPRFERFFNSAVITRMMRFTCRMVPSSLDLMAISAARAVALCSSADVVRMVAAGDEFAAHDSAIGWLGTAELSFRS